MIIVLTGGGSGGHITPILAVAHELKQLKADVRVVYIGQMGGSLNDVPKRDPNIDSVYAVRAGKFRRYHGKRWRQILDFSTQLHNVRDGFLVLAGIWQSFWLIRKLKPQVIFTRGGFVSVPVAIGGKLNGVPFMTHDSDSTPSLANRMVARWATMHAVALPEELYPYPRQKTKMVGVPVGDVYIPVTPQLQQQYRHELKLDKYNQMLFVTGGGNGADQLNKAVANNAPALLKTHPDLVIVHIAGRALETALSEEYDRLLEKPERKRVFVKGFIHDLYRYSGAADVVIARAGATGLAEFAMQGRACIIVPSPQLIWQIHHAKTLAAKGAILELAEATAKEKGELERLVTELLDHRARRERLGKTLAQFARPGAAKELAMLLLEQTAT